MEISVPPLFTLEENTFGVNPRYDTKVSSPYAYSDENTESENNFIKYVNIANVVGYVLSPIVGLVRIVVSAILLRNEKLPQPTQDYLKGQIARGAFEVIGGGYLLWIPDLIVTGIRIHDDNYPYIAKLINGRTDVTINGTLV